ncbi:MAG TPA: NAD(P)/FAD-dependent oxidoreductase [Methylomirabilota bacterium]|jgi:flavin-dependent dehydrogenase
MSEPFRVAVIGAGPAGAVTAMLLAARGASVTLFDDGRRPELLVGESLVPALVPMLKRLGVEEEIASFSRLKPGVSFIWSPTDRFSFTFSRFAPGVYPYTYNTPRPRFDEALLARAVACGAHRVDFKARVEPARGTGTDAEIALTRETLDAAPALGGRQPHLIVDASGRARHVARVLGIRAHVGPRSDVAYFAHYEGFVWDEPPGQLLLSRAEAGWSWCIPLRERLSVGIVLGHADAARLGASPEERIARAIGINPWLSKILPDGKRVTGVATYSNYQLISERGLGPGWVMVGDTFGHVDPMLSPGVFLAMKSAEMVADLLAPVVEGRRAPTPAALAAVLAPYPPAQTAALAAWRELIEYFYDGRVVAAIRAGREWQEQKGESWLKTAMQKHISRHIALQASGARTGARYSRGLLKFLCTHGLRGVDPAELAIR